MNTLKTMFNRSILYFIQMVNLIRAEEIVDEVRIVNDTIADSPLEAAPENQLIEPNESQNSIPNTNNNEAINDPRKVYEPTCKNTSNFFNLLECFIAFTLEYFGQNHRYFQYLDEDKIREAVMKFAELKKDVYPFILSLIYGSKKDDKNVNEDKKAEDEKNLEDQKNVKDVKNVIKENITMPTGNHMLSEKCFKDGFLGCKGTDHAQEIFDLIINNDKNIINLLSIDDEILKSVITHKKMLTVDENNKIVEFLNVLLQNKPNDPTKRLIESNTNGYHLLYPVNNSIYSLSVRLLSNIKDKILEDNEINEPVSA